jgi:hypothetical protein
VFVSPEWETVRVAPFPSVAVLSADVGLPSPVFPSDHLAIAVDLRRTSREIEREFIG